MNYRPRIIPTLLIDDGNLVKTKNFKNPVYLGDPINAVKIFNEKGVDELCVLDISASCNKKEPDYELLSCMAEESFMPLSYGGGINDINQIGKIFRIGYEKVIINSEFVMNEELVRKASSYYGSQSIVASIDYRKTILGSRCFIYDGQNKTDFNPFELALKAEEAGAGEILLYSMDRDGSRKGYDLPIIKEIANSVKIPVIACGGANNIVDLKKAIEAGASAVAAGSMFVFYGKRDAVLINYPEEKDLVEGGVYTYG